MKAFAGCSIVTVVGDRFTLYKDLIMKVWFWHTKFNGIDKTCPKKLAHKRRLRYVNVEMMDEVEGAWRKRRDEERGIV